MRKIHTFLSMVNKREPMHRDIMQTLKTEFPDGLNNQVIPYTSDVEKMGLERAPVTVFAPNSEASEAYQELWIEVRQLLYT